MREKLSLGHPDATDSPSSGLNTPADVVAGPAPQARWRPARLALTAGLLILLAVALWFLFFTAQGQQLRHDRQALTASARALTQRHPFTAPLLFLGLYLLLGVLALPVWWLQVLAGVGFGLWFGTLWSIIAATIGAVVTVNLSRVIAGEWFHTRVEPRLHRLRKLQETLGHNGFLVVMSARLVHVLPMGLCNYAFGLIRMPMVDVILGTFLGSIPAIAFYVGEGAGYHPWKNARFLAVLASINVVLLLPLLLRYLRPQWFRKIGVE